MIIIGTEKEIEAMIEEACPYCISILKCDGDCRACWNRSASIVIADPEKVGDKNGFLYSMTNGNNFIGKEGDQK